MTGNFIASLIVVVFIVFGIICGIFAGIYPMSAEGFKYNTEVHSHIENAYYAADPDTMLEEIVAAKEGMKNVGLTDNMYNALFPWDKTPDRSMKWQYKHIDSIIIRIEEFKQWEESQSASSGSSQQMKDVYTEKLNNVRFFIQEDGWSDDIAEGAYKLNFGFMYVLAGIIGGLCLLLFFIIMLLVVALD